MASNLRKKSKFDHLSTSTCNACPKSHKLLPGNTQLYIIGQTLTYMNALAFKGELRLREANESMEFDND